MRETFDPHTPRAIAPRLTLALCALALALALMPASATAATSIGVTTTADTLSATDGRCSLREAILAANSDAASGAVAGECPAGSGTDTVVLPAGHYALGIAPTGADDGTTGDLDITSDLTLQGAGARTTIIDAAHVDRVLTVGTFNSGAAVTIEGVTITGGRGQAGAGGADSDGGGGIKNYADLTVRDSTVTNNETGRGGDAVCVSCNAGSAGGGGGVQNRGRPVVMPPFGQLGSLTIERSTISDNFTGDGGDSTGPGGFAGAGGEGGGVESIAALSILDSTIAGNHTGNSGTAANVIPNSQGAGLLSANTTTLTNVTVAGNQTGAGGHVGGLDQANGGVTVRNSVIASNTGSNCAGGSITDGGHNLSSPAADTSCPPTFASGAALLGALQDNGGPTDTMLPAAGSAALDVVPAAGAGCAPADQRGIMRPIGPACDAGAVERAVPSARTGGAAVLGIGSAAISGLAANPGFTAGSARFEYGFTAAYGAQTTPSLLPAMSANVPLAATLTGLAAGRLYHYRVVATGPEGTAIGADRTFTTAVPAPVSPPLCHGRAATIVAHAGRPTRGTSHADVIVGTSGKDTIDGRGGNDLICAGAGGDRITGGAGRDRVYGEAGNDRITGGSGNDRIYGGAGNDTLGGGSGNDRVDGGSGNDHLDEQKLGGKGKDVLIGGRGNDVIDTAGGQPDRVDCGPGRDRVTADRVDHTRHCERIRLRSGP